MHALIPEHTCSLFADPEQFLPPKSYNDIPQVLVRVIVAFPQVAEQMLHDPHASHCLSVNRLLGRSLQNAWLRSNRQIEITNLILDFSAI